MKAEKEKIYLRLKDLLITFALLAIATCMGVLFSILEFPEANIIIIYLLVILLTARFTTGLVYGIIASFIAIFLFNYFFTKPYYTFYVSNPTYFITFVIMIITSIVTSTLTAKVKQSAMKALEKEKEISALYEMTNQLNNSIDIEDIESISVRIISHNLSCMAGFLGFGDDGLPKKYFIQQKEDNRQVRVNIDKDDTILKDYRLNIPYFKGKDFYDWPIYNRKRFFGLIRIPISYDFLSDGSINLLKAMIESVGMALDRGYNINERIKAGEEMLQERYRANLLRAISHDLRTPLSGILGTSQILMGITKKKDERYELANSIYKEANWLYSLVENILSLTRLQDKKIFIDKQPEAVEEIVEVAVNIINKRTNGYEIFVNTPKELLLVPMDAKLIVQVLVNLLDNAIKHSISSKEIFIDVSLDIPANSVFFSIKDEGIGIPEEDLGKIFQKFYTRHGKDSGEYRGLGLGLAICEAIVKTHGGNIYAKNREDRSGAEFIFSLPMEVGKDEK